MKHSPEQLAATPTAACRASGPSATTAPSATIGPSTPPSRRRRRRTQEERSAETRALLLDATVTCLAELGFAGATAQVIAERAGLSRGAQLHHFGSKTALVLQAMEHLFERRLAEFRRGFEALPRDGGEVAAAMPLLWSMVSGPAGHAYLELVIASRTDPELAEAMRALTRRMDVQVELAFRDLFQAAGRSELFETAWTALFALLEGLAIERIVRPDDRRLDDVLRMLEQVAPTVLCSR